MNHSAATMLFQKSSRKLICLFFFHSQKLQDIFASGARRTPMSFCDTPSMPCRKPVSMATLSEALLVSNLLTSRCEYCIHFLLVSFLLLYRLDRQTQATTLVHQIFGGYLRSRGIIEYYIL